MNASTAPLTLGTNGPNKGTISLPYNLESGGHACRLLDPSSAAHSLSEDKQCVMVIRISGGQDTCTWRSFWEVAVALTGMCARMDRKGARTGLGESSR